MTHRFLRRGKQEGVRFRGAVTEDDAGRVVYFEDPDGNSMYIMEVRQWSSADRSHKPEYQNRDKEARSQEQKPEWSERRRSADGWFLPEWS